MTEIFSTHPFLAWTAALTAAAVVVCVGVRKWGPVKRLRRRFRTARAGVVWNRRAGVVDRPVTCSVVVTLTAAPSRMSGLPRIIASLLNQTCPPDEVHVNIPHVFGRTGESYSFPPDWPTDTRVKVFRVEDLGPATKFAHTVDRIPLDADTIIVVVDDDVLYLQEAIEGLLRAVGRSKTIAVGFSGYRFGPAWETVLAQSDAPVEVVEGWAAFATHRAAFGAGLADYLRAAHASRSCFLHDDVVISNWFAMRGVARMQLATRSVNRRRMRRLGAQLAAGYQAGALHGISAPAVRARESGEHLASLGIWALNSPIPSNHREAP